MRKQDLTLMRQIKQQEDKARQAKQRKDEAEDAKSAVGISFDLWWVEINKQLELANHIKEIMLVDFKARGLRAVEPAAKYNEALALFGYKL